jgi:signal transduction histidine kinase
MIEMTIEDDGPGLSDQQAIDVIRPGHRLDESAPGDGFGLPITRELADLYGELSN